MNPEKISTHTLGYRRKTAPRAQHNTPNPLQQEMKARQSLFQTDINFNPQTSCMTGEHARCLQLLTKLKPLRTLCLYCRLYPHAELHCTPGRMLRTGRTINPLNPHKNKPRSIELRLDDLSKELDRVHLGMSLILQCGLERVLSAGLAGKSAYGLDHAH